MDGMNKRVITLFCIVNCLLIAAVISLWLYPEATELFNIKALINIQESRYALKENNLWEYESNKLTLAELNQAENSFNIIPYADLAGTMSLISGLADSFQLKERDFSVSEPVVHDAQEVIFHSIRIAASYEGADSQIYRFIESLSEMPCHIDGLTITHTEPTEANLWLLIRLIAED